MNCKELLFLYIFGKCVVFGCMSKVHFTVGLIVASGYSLL